MVQNNNKSHPRNKNLKFVKTKITINTHSEGVESQGGLRKKVKQIWLQIEKHTHTYTLYYTMYIICALSFVNLTSILIIEEKQAADAIGTYISLIISLTD